MTDESSPATPDKPQSTGDSQNIENGGERVAPSSNDPSSTNVGSTGAETQDSQLSGDPQNQASGAQPESAAQAPSVPEKSGEEQPRSEGSQANADVDAANVDAANAEAASGPAESVAEEKTRRNIQVGSRRGESAKKSLPNKPVRSVPELPQETASNALPDDGSAKVAPEDVPTVAAGASGGKVEAPTKRSPLPADLEQAVDEAMASISVDDLMTGEATNRAAQDIELETRRQAKIVRMHGDHVFFSIGGRNEGVASIRQFKEPPSIGDEMEVVVKSFQADDGLYEVTVPGASISVADWSDLTEGAVVEVRITGANTGGLEGMVNQIRGFIPASQIGLFRVEDFAEYIGQKLDCVATEVNEKRRNLVLSHRAYLERERQEAREKLLEKLEPGLILEGVVRSLRDFGAFVDIGGLDGLIHISQLSWDRVNHPSDVLSEGQRVRVRVEKVNAETGKIGLSYRDLLDHPWEKVEDDFSVGNTVRGPVTRIAKFGAFVKLASGVEGLIHISELAHHRIRSVSDVVQEGQEVEVKILSIDTDAQRIGLSLKATQEAPEKSDSDAKSDQSDEPAPQPTVQERSRPLKGGFDRPTGGESIGLKW